METQKQLTSYQLVLNHRSKSQKAVKDATTNHLCQTDILNLVCGVPDQWHEMCPVSPIPRQ